MILVWNDNKSFSRHLETMRRFRGEHRANIKCSWEIIKDLPELRDMGVPSDTGGTRSYLEVAGPAVVPLWKFTLPAGVIN